MSLADAWPCAPQIKVKGCIPSARTRFADVVLGSQWIIHGGLQQEANEEDEEEPQNDFNHDVPSDECWAFSFETEEWSQVDFVGESGPLLSSGMLLAVAAADADVLPCAMPCAQAAAPCPGEATPLVSCWAAWCWWAATCQRLTRQRRKGMRGEAEDKSLCAPPPCLQLSLCCRPRARWGP